LRFVNISSYALYSMLTDDAHMAAL